jgi:hypothetical protein
VTRPNPNAERGQPAPFAVYGLFLVVIYHQLNQGKREIQARQKEQYF